MTLSDITAVREYILNSEPAQKAVQKLQRSAISSLTSKMDLSTKQEALHLAPSLAKELSASQDLVLATLRSLPAFLGLCFGALVYGSPSPISTIPIPIPCC